LDGKSKEQSEEKRKKALYPRPETPRLYGPNGNIGLDPKTGEAPEKIEDEIKLKLLLDSYNTRKA
jgi:hypothetical protein